MNEPDNPMVPLGELHTGQRDAAPGRAQTDELADRAVSPELSGLGSDGAYQKFLQRKSQYGKDSGFEPLWLPDFLFDFQKSLVEWAIQKGRAAIFADTGLGKTVMELVFAQNVWQREQKPVLLITPLAVSRQIIREGEKFGIRCVRSLDGRVAGPITVTNYDRLHHFIPNDWVAVVGDESSIVKHFGGATQKFITRFLAKIPYRLLCTATPSPI